MIDLPSTYILSVKPKEYLVQGISHCGVYCVKGILGAYGKDDKIHPKDYHTNWIGKNLFNSSHLRLIVLLLKNGTKFCPPGT